MFNMQTSRLKKIATTNPLFTQFLQTTPTSTTVWILTSTSRMTVEVNKHRGTWKFPQTHTTRTMTKMSPIQQVQTHLCNGINATATTITITTTATTTTATVTAVTPKPIFPDASDGLKFKVFNM
eukprot:m.195796 g.195796  ORF g.195796 m.195796 type:complete len:124 (-) comp32586_c0_seq3:243-614(-)